MNKHWLRNSLSLLLTGAMLLAVLPVGAMAAGMDDETTQFPAGEKPPIAVDPSEDETPIVPILPQKPGDSVGKVLYSWTASDSNRDVNAFTSNLPDEFDLKQRWNETAQMYTEQACKTVSMHSFLNKVEGTYGLKAIKDFAGRTAVENLQVDVYPMAQVNGSIGAVSMTLVYAHKPTEYALNPANSGLLRVHASADGVNWSEEYATVRSARIVGSGIGQNGEDIIFYEIVTEDLKAIAGNEINVLRILPDGNSGQCAGGFSLCQVTVNGYKTKTEFHNAVPAERAAATADRNTVMAAYKNATGSDGLARVQAAMAPVTRAKVASIPAMLDTLGLRLAEGIAIKATDDVLRIFEWMAERRLRTWSNMQPILDEYERFTNTEEIIKDLNRPQQIFKAYAKCVAGDLLVQAKKNGTKNVYMIEKINVQYDKAGNVNIATSTVTYVDNKGTTHAGASLFQLYTQGFVPMVIDALADDAVQPVRVDAHVSGVNKQVRVAVSAGFDIKKIDYAVQGTAILGTVFPEQRNEAVVFSGDNLNQLPVGTYTITVNVYTESQPQVPVSQTVSFKVLPPVRTVTVGTVSNGMVTVSTKSGALGANVTVTATPDPGFALKEILVDGNPISGHTFSISQDHVVTAVFEQVIIGLTTTLGNSLSVDFMIDVSKLTGVDNYAQITKYYADGRAPVVVKIPQNDWILYSEKTPNYYYASFTGVCAKEMSDNFDVVIFDGSGHAVTTGKTDSLCDYAMRMLARDDVIQKTELRTVYVDMLNYGAQAQLEFKYNTGKLANRLLSAQQQQYATESVAAQSNAEKSGWIVGTALTLEHQIVMDFVIADNLVDTYEGMYAVATYTDHYGHEKQVQVNEVERFNASHHQVSVSGMAIADFRQMVTLVLYNSQGQEVGRSTDSVEGYVVRMESQIGEIGQAILKFGQSSYNYFH